MVSVWNGNPSCPLSILNNVYPQPPICSKSHMNRKGSGYQGLLHLCSLPSSQSPFQANNFFFFFLIWKNTTLKHTMLAKRL